MKNTSFQSRLNYLISSIETMRKKKRNLTQIEKNNLGQMVSEQQSLQAVLNRK